MNSLLNARLRGVFAALFVLVCVTPVQAAPACPAPGTWHVARAGALVPRPAREVLETMAAREVVLLGEHHDDAAHHAWQLQTLGALHTLRPAMVLGFEAFPRRVQPVLDRWVAGELTEAAFLRDTNWATVWRVAAEQYLPLLRFARIHRIPMIALNVERGLTEAIAKSGLDAVPEDQREGVSRPAAASPAYRASLFEVYSMHVRRRATDGKTVAPLDTEMAAPANAESAASRNATTAAPSEDDAEFRNFVEAQTTWDRAMAEALAAHVGASGKPLVVGVMGSGHIRYGHGVPHQLRALGVTGIGTLLPYNLEHECAPPPLDLADAVFAVPQIPGDAPPPPRLGVSLAQEGKVVRILTVVPDSLAASVGLQKGDRITTVAGRVTDRVGDVISAVRAQPPGTVLPFGIERDAVSIEIMVRFPPKE